MPRMTRILPPPPDARRQFASDNYAGICPEAWAALAEANRGHVPSYGNDPWTARGRRPAPRAVRDRLRGVFRLQRHRRQLAGARVAVPVATTASSAHETAHVRDRRMRRAGVLLQRHQDARWRQAMNGKLTAGEHRSHRSGARSDIHYPKPRVVSITQATELGTVYSLDELHGDPRRRQDATACGSTWTARGSPTPWRPRASTPKEITWQCGVDVLCLGGTKNGAGRGRRGGLLQPELAQEFDYRCKQAGQLASKMRFLAAPWVGLLETAPGCGTRRTPTRWRRGWRRGCGGSPGRRRGRDPAAGGGSFRC